jgi:hypothetical protein
LEEAFRKMLIRKCWSEKCWNILKNVNKKVTRIVKGKNVGTFLKNVERSLIKWRKMLSNILKKK